MISDREIFFQHMGPTTRTPLAVEIESAEGIYLYGKDQKAYIDLVSGVSVSNLGHNHPAIRAAIKEQVDKFTHLMVYGELIQTPQTRLAQMLAEYLPSELNCTYFVNSGSEAIEGALKLAKRYTGRHEIVSFYKAYHGSTHGALSVLGDEGMKYAFRPLLPSIKQIEFNNPDHLKLISKETACVLVEPIQAEAGIIIPDPGYLQRLRNVCNKTGALLIFDEIQMGMGRTGKLFCFENEQVVPDILCLAKALGAGMPLGAFISSGQIMHSLAHHPSLGHITTFGGHPVSCAAAVAGLQIINQTGFLDDVEKKGKMIADLLKIHPMIHQIRRKGMMLGLDLAQPEKLDPLMQVFLKNGLLVDRFLFNEKAFRIAPPLTITETEIEEICQRVNQSLQEIMSS